MQAPGASGWKRSNQAIQLGWVRTSVARMHPSKLLVPTVIFLLLLSMRPGWSQPPGSPIPEDKRIVPGQRIGTWSLDMTVDDLKKSLDSPPDRGSPSQFYRRGPAFVPSMVVYRWELSNNRGLYAGSLDDRKIEYLEIRDESYKVGTHLPAPGPGSDKDFVSQVMGPESFSRSYADGALSLVVYDKIGVAFTVGTVGFGIFVARTESVAVFRPNRARSIWR